MIYTPDLLVVLAAAALYALAAGAVLLVRARAGKTVRPLREFAKLLFYCSVAVVLLVTVRPSIRMHDVPPGFLCSVNLIPFSTISSYFRDAEHASLNVNIIVNNLLGNIMLFLPMGLFVPALWPAFRRLWKCVLLCALASLAIELLQLAMSFFGMSARTTDVDDVILNTLGGLAGYGLYALGVFVRGNYLRLKGYLQFYFKV